MGGWDLRAKSNAGAGFQSLLAEFPGPSRLKMFRVRKVEIRNQWSPKQEEAQSGKEDYLANTPLHLLGVALSEPRM